MRGVASGDNGNHSGPLPSVGMYLDEQPITTIQGALDIHLYDIARVEALAGPQGTLYGASSQAGTHAHHHQQARPGWLRGRLRPRGQHGGARRRGLRRRGLRQHPAQRQRGHRLVGWVRARRRLHRQRAGHAHLSDVGASAIGAADLDAASPAHAEDDYNDVDTYGARAALRIELNDNWTITPSRHGPEAEGQRQLRLRPAAVGRPEARALLPGGQRRQVDPGGADRRGASIGNLDLVYAGSFLKRDDRSWTRTTRTTRSCTTTAADMRLYWTDRPATPLANPVAVHPRHRRLQAAEPRAARHHAGRQASALHRRPVLPAPAARHLPELPDQRLDAQTFR